MIKRELIDVACVITPEGQVQQAQREEMTYLILFYATDPDTGEEIRTFEVVDGRQRACDKIIDMQQYMQIDLIKSQVISEKITNILVSSISCYTFLRYCVDPTYMGENTIKFGDDGDGNFMTVENLNEFVMIDYEDILNEMGIYDLDDLNRFYQCDFNHVEYTPEEYIN